MPQSSSPDTQRYPALDGMRGLAATVTVIYHLFIAGWAANPIVNLLQHLMFFGWVGVDLFFVLSGFLITGILLNQIDSHSYFRTFYARRALRIFPIYYLLVLLAIVFPHAFQVQWGGLQWLYLSDLQNNLGFLHRTGYDNSSIQHLWTLGLEEQFYFLWPVIVYVCRNRQRLLLGSLVACACAPVLRTVLYFHGADVSILANSTPCRFDGLLLGSCVALGLNGGVAPEWREAIVRRSGLLCGISLASILVLTAVRQTFRNEDPGVCTIGFTLLDIFFALLLLRALEPTGFVRRCFSVGWLRWVGTYSYGLYVYHEVLAHKLESLRTMVDAHHSKLVAVFVTAIVVGALSLGLAVVSYHFFEMPFLRMKRFFRYECRPHSELVVGASASG